MMNFEQLQTFKLIVQAGTFSRAAEELFLTQPAISQRIRHLEQALGVALFHRDGNHRVLRLTPAGEQVLRFADEAVALADQLRLDLKNTSRTDQRATITIACSPAPAKYILPRLLTAFYEQHPYVRVVLIQANSDEIASIVTGGGAELGMVMEKYVTDRTLQMTPVVRDRAVLIAPIDHPAVFDPIGWFATADRYPFILAPANSYVRQMAERWAGSLGIKLDVVIETWSLDLVKEAVMRGLGLAVVPAMGVSDELRDDRLRVVAAPGLLVECRYGLIFNLERVLSPGAERFVSLVRGRASTARAPSAARPCFSTSPSVPNRPYSDVPSRATTIGS